MFRFMRSVFNITLLFSALVVTPLLALSHFNAALADMLGDYAARYIPNPTLLHKQKAARLKAETRLQEKRLGDARERASKRGRAASSSKVAKRTGKRVLVRGAGALLVGWVPVIGMTADVVSLAEDYTDICQLFSTMDELLAMLYLPDENLYEENYCHLPDKGIEVVKQTARETRFPWEDM